jgi:hypothetical protein
MNAKRNYNSLLVSLLASWQVAPAHLARALEQVAGLGERASAIGRLLRELLPAAQLVACRLGSGKSPAQAIDGSGGAEAKSLALAALDNQVQGAQEPHVSKDGTLSCVSAALKHGNRSWGGISVVIPTETFEEVGAAVLGLISFTAALLALHLELEQGNSGAATTDRLSAELIHELNNGLNTMVLQAAVVQAKVDESLRAELAAIRQVGAQVAERLRGLEKARPA